MNVEEFLNLVVSASSKFLLKVKTLAKTDNAIKLRIQISENIPAQFLSFPNNKDVPL